MTETKQGGHEKTAKTNAKKAGADGGDPKKGVKPASGDPLGFGVHGVVPYGPTDYDPDDDVGYHAIARRKGE